MDAPNPGSCQTAAFLFGGDSYTRKYDIKVSQFDCGSEAGGPPGCLQYFTAASGKIASFGYDTTTTTVSSTGIYLHYNYTLAKLHQFTQATPMLHPRYTLAAP